MKQSHVRIGDDTGIWIVANRSSGTFGEIAVFRKSVSASRICQALRRNLSEIPSDLQPVSL